MTKRIINCLFLLICFMHMSCMDLSLPEGWRNPQSHNDAEVKYSDFSYFGFLKEDNPGVLNSDIICTSLDPYNLMMISEADVELPCELIPRFDVGDGSIIWNGDELISGETPIYCSNRNPAQITVTGVGPVNEFHSISFLPNTGLPVVVVVTDGCTPVEFKQLWLPGEMKTYGFGKLPDTRDSVSVRKRGNGTATFPKVAFNIKFEKKRSVLGMPKSKTWCFLANFRDRTEIRNAVAFKLGQMADGLEWTPQSQFAELILNGKHEGLYQITEKIGVNKNRVDIEETGADSADVNVGYLLEMDNYYDEVWKFRTAINGWPVNIKSPDDEKCDSSFLDCISTFYNGFEQCLVNGDYETASSQYYDMNSFIDYGLVQSLTNNGEFFNHFSVFGYKKKDGKLFAGPLWDFDYRTFNSADEFLFTNGIWYKYLIYDTSFVSSVKSRWNSYKAKVDPYIFDYIDSLATALSSSAHVDETIYPFSIFMPAQKNGDEEMTFEEAVAKMKQVLSDRISKMDILIDGL